ncbi:hypothetical protein Tco_0977481 [Tanacetum coccineum]|uniref:Uncharacterized protein n=1 Tax=Tanacetum coccineum TaxID=301880 RepID=A0ABQ5EKA9_9ASTR
MRRYLKGQPKLGLWYPKDSPFILVAYTDSDYAGASLDRKSTTRGCQFLGCRLISWQCKKQIVVANSTTEVEYVAASSCCGQVLWIQNQLLDYGYNFMHTKIFIDNNRKAKKHVKLMMQMLFRIELELMLFWSTVIIKTINGGVQLDALIDGKKIIITESSVRRDLQLADEEGVDCLPNATIFEQLTLIGKPKRKDTQVPQPSDPIKNVADKAIHKELGDSLMRAATTASSIEVEQDSGARNIEGLLLLKLGLRTVLDLEKTKTTQHNEIASLKRRVKKLKKKDRSRTHRLKRLYKVGLTARVESSYNKESLGEDASKQGSIDAIDADEEITLIVEEVFVADTRSSAVLNRENKEVNVIEDW